MAVIQWWILQIETDDLSEFGNRYVANYESGMSAEDAIDEAGKSILADEGLIPGERYLWRPDWVDAEKQEYEEAQ